MEQKKELRKRLAEEKKRHKADELKQLSDVIFGFLENLPVFQKAKVVLLYHSLPDEVQTHLFIEKWYKEKEIILPVVQGDELELRAYTSPQETAVGAFGIVEPQGKRVVEYDRIDLAIIPGVGFDANRHRLGRGKGYYDKLLPCIAAPKIGVCFPFQVVELVPTDRHDVSMDWVMSDKGVITT